MKRSHKNNKARLTNKERVAEFLLGHPLAVVAGSRKDLLKLVQAAGRATLARRGPSPATIKRRFLAQLRAGTWQHTESMREAIDLAINGKAD